MQIYTFFLNKRQQFTEKLTKFFICLLFLSISIPAYSQNEVKVTMGRNANTIGLAIKSVEVQTGYRVLYDNKLDVGKRITLPTNTMPLSSVLSLILKDTGCSYTIVNKLIGIRYDGLYDPQTAIALTGKSTIARYGSISGIVVDSKTGLFMGEVLVTLKGVSDVNLVTDVQGKFVAEKLPLGQYNIVAAHKGYTISSERISLSENNIRGELIMNLCPELISYVSDIHLVPSLSPANDFKLNNTIIRYTPAASTPIGNPKVALKTNLVLAATTSPNLAVEVRLSDKLTLDIPVSYNPWKFKNNKLFRHLLVQPELRYWTHESFNGHFFGANLIYSFINMGNIKMPLGLWSDMKDYRFEGNVFGAGVSYGYQWMLSKRFSMEATVGVGYAYADYDKFPYIECGKLIKHESKHYFGPTKLGLSLIYFIK